MAYYYSKMTSIPYEAALVRVTEALKAEGFGVLTEIDVKETLKKKIGVDFRKYKILGACSPSHAHQALLTEDKAGVFLPCNVVVQEWENGQVEIAAVSPKASMMAIDNPSLMPIAEEIEQKMKRLIDTL